MPARETSPDQPRSRTTRSRGADGRTAAPIIRRYLDALAEPAPRRSPERLRARLVALRRELRTASSLKRVQLIQEEIDLREALASPAHDLARLESDFVKVVKAYSNAKGLSAAAWREAGVPARVLVRAGLTKGRGPAKRSEAPA